MVNTMFLQLQCRVNLVFLNSRVCIKDEKKKTIIHNDVLYLYLAYEIMKFESSFWSLLILDLGSQVTCRFLYGQSDWLRFFFLSFFLSFLIATYIYRFAFRQDDKCMCILYIIHYTYVMNIHSLWLLHIDSHTHSHNRCIHAMVLNFLHRKKERKKRHKSIIAKKNTNETNNRHRHRQASEQIV